MRKATLAILVLFTLLSPLVLLFTSLVPAKAASPGVYIQEGGSVQGTSSILHIGDQYTFMGDIGGPLYVQKDNVVIDGAGYTVTGANGRGIVLSQRHGITIRNTRVTLDGGYIINLEGATDCALVGNTLIGASGLLSMPIAIHFLHSQSITVKDNKITNFFTALSLQWSSGHTITGNLLVDGVVGIDICNTTGCVFKDNQLRNCSFSMRIYPEYLYENNLDASNTIDGKPIYYLVDAKDIIVPSDAAYIILVRCANAKVNNCTPEGISLISTKDSIIANVKMMGRGDGINLLDSSSISIVNNVLSDHAIGIEIENSSNSKISGNVISNYITRGIALKNTINTVISGNSLSNNSYAIAPSSGCIIASNNFTGNDYAVTADGNMKIIDNVFENNEHAILFSDGSGTIVTQNTFNNNKNALYFGGSSGNSIYLNNFLNNERQVVDGGVNVTYTKPVKAGFDSMGSLQLLVARVDGVNFLPPPPPSINQYDNGAKGNYWIDYHGSDKNGDGIGDTAYYVYENNQDNYPLMKPVLVSGMQTAPGESASSILNPSGQPLDDDNMQYAQTTAGLEMPIVIVIAAVMVVGAILLVYRKKHKHKSRLATT
jgi:parallel beta-helix repeat protein